MFVPEYPIVNGVAWPVTCLSTLLPSSLQLFLFSVLSDHLKKKKTVLSTHFPISYVCEPICVRALTCSSGCVFGCRNQGTSGTCAHLNYNLHPPTTPTHPPSPVYGTLTFLLGVLNHTFNQRHLWETVRDVKNATNGVCFDKNMTEMSL